MFSCGAVNRSAPQIQSSPLPKNAPLTRWTRIKTLGAPVLKFIMADLDLAFTFLDIATTSWVADTACRNQENARAAYDVVLRFLPRSIAALSVAERQTVQDKLKDLRSRLPGTWGRILIQTDVLTSLRYASMIAALRCGRAHRWHSSRPNSQDHVRSANRLE
jgi:hypothetical protein